MTGERRAAVLTSATLTVDGTLRLRARAARPRRRRPRSACRRSSTTRRRRCSTCRGGCRCRRTSATPRRWPGRPDNCCAARAAGRSCCSPATRRCAPWSRLLELELDYPVLVQGTAPRSVLLEEFRRTPHAVLFATSSFWQGVDVQGEQLSAVIIDKLPFVSPGDPIVAARIEALTRRGDQCLRAYQVPLAILALLQGLGRLIRHRTDRGVLAVLDPRLRTMGYGRRFLDSLPPAPITHDVEDVRAVLRSVRRGSGCRPPPLALPRPALHWPSGGRDPSCPHRALSRLLAIAHGAGPGRSRPRPDRPGQGQGRRRRGQAGARRRRDRRVHGRREPQARAPSPTSAASSCSSACNRAATAYRPPSTSSAPATSTCSVRVGKTAEVTVRLSTVPAGTDPKVAALKTAFDEGVAASRANDHDAAIAKFQEAAGRTADLLRVLLQHRLRLPAEEGREAGGGELEEGARAEGRPRRDPERAGDALQQPEALRRGGGDQRQGGGHRRRPATPTRSTTRASSCGTPARSARPRSSSRRPSRPTRTTPTRGSSWAWRSSTRARSPMRWRPSSST